MRQRLQVTGRNPLVQPRSGKEGWFNKFRSQQQAAFQLPGWETSFLWGPPGTGKTTVNGAMIGQFLVQFPRSRILLVSNTNHAVDQLLVMVDKALEHLAQTQTEAQSIRGYCVRVGSNFKPAIYRKREHLIRRGGLSGFSLPEFDNVVAQARLVSMTTTRAVHTLGELREAGAFEWLVCDEAGQVGLAQAGILLPLARHAMFAGDPNQLGPILKTRHPDAAVWLGGSIFERMRTRSPWSCFLNEQSRMSSPICELVSRLFYEDQLKVASGCAGNFKWEAERRLDAVSIFNHAVQRLEIKSGVINSPRYGGRIRPESARVISQVVGLLMAEGLAETQLVVLSAFRAQQKLIREYLSLQGCHHVKVCTVHGAQGGEWHTVIFDPVDGESSFFKGANALRLVNVAVSRSKGRFLIALSQADERNPLFHRLSAAIQQQNLRSVLPPSKPPVAT